MPPWRPTAAFTGNTTWKSLAGLTSMGIPYKTEVYDQRYLKDKRQESLELQRLLGHGENLTETRTIALHKYDMGALAFLLTEYLKSQFSNALFVHFS